MAEGVFGTFGGLLLEAYQSFLSILPSSVQNFLNWFLLVLVVVLYCVFIWKFYKFISKKDFLGLNLRKYKTETHAFFEKLIAGGLYFVEYILITPFVVFFAFLILTIFILVLTEELALSQILLISGTIIAVVRMCAYYKEDLAQDIAKLLPFMLLTSALLSPSFFSFERILTHLSEIPNFLGEIKVYLLFIVLIELILRTFESIFSIFNLSDEPIAEQEKEN